MAADHYEAGNVAEIALICALSTGTGHSGTAHCESIAVLDPSHYDLLVKYDSTENLDFDAGELATICKILNLNITTFTETRLADYRRLILESAREQSKIMTEITGEYLIRLNQGKDLEAVSYVVENIARISSPYMLNILVSLLAHKA